MIPPGLAGGLDALEIVSGIVFGRDADVAEPRPRASSPVAAWERSLLPLLTAPPCGVTFSGGRDSSAVLATATMVARKHGLDDPLPITLRYPGIEEADETTYQELVIRHLGLDEWVLLEPGDSLDILGDIATQLTNEHGLLYPGNIQSMVPMLDCVHGGSLLTGLGGDEVMGAHPNHDLAAMVLGRRRPTRPLMKSLIKHTVWRSRLRGNVRSSIAAHFTWLVPEVREAAIERLVDDAVGDLMFADRNLTDITYRARYLHRAAADIRRIASARGVVAAHPFLDPEFVGAMALRNGRVGYPSRADAMAEAFGALLPSEVIRRTTKAQFSGVFWTERAATLAPRLPLVHLEDLVDGAALHRHWASDAPKGNTYLIAKLLMHNATNDGLTSGPRTA